MKAESAYLLVGIGFLSFFIPLVVLRLAILLANQYILQDSKEKKNSYFAGVPSPAGAIILLAPIILEVNIKRFGCQVLTINPLYMPMGYAS